MATNPNSTSENGKLFLNSSLSRTTPNNIFNNEDNGQINNQRSAQCQQPNPNTNLFPICQNQSEIKPKLGIPPCENSYLTENIPTKSIQNQNNESSTTSLAGMVQDLYFRFSENVKFFSYEIHFCSYQQ